MKTKNHPNKHEGENIMQLDLTAALIGGEILGVVLGENRKQQQKRIFNELQMFFNNVENKQLIAFVADNPRVYTNAHLSKKNGVENPLIVDENGLQIHTHDKTFAWSCNDGFITITVFDNVLSVQQNTEDGDETLTQFVRW